MVEVNLAVQVARPLGQVERVRKERHVPPVHTWPARHGIRHPPQLAGSLEVSTHFPKQNICPTGHSRPCAFAADWVMQTNRPIVSPATKARLGGLRPLRKAPLLIAGQPRPPFLSQNPPCHMLRGKALWHLHCFPTAIGAAEAERGADWKKPSSLVQGWEQCNRPTSRTKNGLTFWEHPSRNHDDDLACWRSNAARTMSSLPQLSLQKTFLTCEMRRYPHGATPIGHTP